MISQKVKENLSEVIFDSDLKATRMWLFIAEFYWALFLFWPGETFDRPTYAVMAQVMSETAWGFVFLISASLQLSVVAFAQYTRDWAKTFANFNAVLWVFVVGSAFISVQPPPAAMGAECAAAMAAVFIWIRPLVEEHMTIKYKKERRSISYNTVSCDNIINEGVYLDRNTRGSDGC